MFLKSSNCRPSTVLYICRDASTNHLFLCKTNPILSAVGGLQMNANPYNTTDYGNKGQRRVRKNKPNSNPIKPNFTYPQRGKTEVRCRMSEVRYLSSAFCFLSSVHGRLLINPMLPLYKLSNVQYYSRRRGRCSSMVERSFRKAEVVGPTPTIGFRKLMYIICVNNPRSKLCTTEKLSRL